MAGIADAVTASWAEAMQLPAQSHADLRLRLLGTFSLSSAGQEIVVPGLRSRALLAFLACNAEKTYTREKLVGLLWGERFEEQARQSLRQTLTALRKIVSSDLIDTDRSDVGLKETFSSDVGRFLSLLATGDRDRLREAVSLYRDDLLAGFSLEAPAFMDWLATERARLRDLALGALETLMEPADGDVAPAQLLELAQRALSIDPYREQAHRQLLRALALAGRRNDALMHYRQLERLLQSDLGVQPEAATREVLEVVRSDTISDRYQHGTELRPPDQSRPHSPLLEDKPAIAVLPFDNIGGDAAMSRLADGITADIITDLGRFRDVDVIARNSTAVYKGKPVDVRRIGRDLNVHYVLGGSIQRYAQQIRVSAQLIDASTGGTLWSNRWDRPDRDIFAVQTEVAEQVAATLGGTHGSSAITAEEIRKAKRRPPESLTAYDYYLLANEGRTLFTRESIARGIEAATKAIAIEPTLGRAYVARAWLNYITVHCGADVEAAMQAMEADALRGLELDPYDPEARVALAFYLTGRGRFAECEAQSRAALQANPSNPQVLVVAAAMFAWCGKPDEAGELADKVMRLDPWMTPENLNCVKDAYFFGRRFQDAIAVVSRIPKDARGRGSRLMLTLSYALLGRSDEAERARAELLAAYPSISAELLLNQDWVSARPEEESLLLEGFRAARLPLCASDAELAAIPNARRLPECAARAARN
jgi:TolB-like protein/tetratricopeptide (TPR) repeat protein